MAGEAICPRCQHANPLDANFCSSCGLTLSSIVDEPTEMLHLDELGLHEHPVAGFLVRRGPKAGSRYELDPGVTSIGRHPESDIFLDDITVSRRHAEVARQGDDYAARDVGSLNGTYLNKVRIDTAELHPGDELQVGKFKLVFFVEEPG